MRALSVRDCGCDGRRQVAKVDELLVAEGDRPLDAVLQFANIARPIVLQQAISWPRW